MVMGMSGGGGIHWANLLRHITRLHQHFRPINPALLYSTKSPPRTSTKFSTSLPNSNAFFFNPSRMRIISHFCTIADLEDDGDKDDKQKEDKDDKRKQEKDDKRRKGQIDDEESDDDLPDVNELLAELRREEKQIAAEREARKANGEPELEEEEEDDDYMGLGEIKDYEDKREPKAPTKGSRYFSDDEGTDDDDYLDPGELQLAQERDKEKQEQYVKRAKKYKELVENFYKSSTFDEAYKLMGEIERFRAQHYTPSNEYKVLGWLLNRLSEATGKERFILQLKVQRALKHLRWKAEFDPQNPDNWGVMKSGNEKGLEAEKEVEEEKDEEDEEDEENEGDKIEEKEKENEGDQSEEKDEDEDTFDEDIEEALSEQVQSIDKEIKRKLAEMELTFGKQSRDLEEEIKELFGQRQSLTVKTDVPLYRKGFDVKLIDVNRTCKVTKGGQVQKYSAIVAVGNFNGIVGYGKAKNKAVASAIQRAHVKSFENLHYIERYKEHTVAHAIQAKFKKTKIYLWPGAINTGMRANKTVESILHLAGLRNVKTKVIGSRNAENTVKALFKALNMIETPQDIQEKFGRSVVESYLLK